MVAIPSVIALYKKKLIQLHVQGYTIHSSLIYNVATGL